jgi:predicted DNA-binding protein YlxM (UPF0122 family)
MKLTFTDIEIKTIIDLYTKDGLNTTKIGVKLGISKTPIYRVLKDNGLLRKGSSNGVKISLTNEQEITIKNLYLKEYYSILEISEKTGLTTSFIDKYLKNVGYRRDKEKASSISSVRKYSGVSYDEYLANLPEYEKYRKKVINITNKQPIKNLPNYNKRGNYKNINAYHLDHKYSISEGFKNGVSPEVIDDIENLEFIPWKENLKKKNKCSITMTQLINK